MDRRSTSWRRWTVVGALVATGVTVGAAGTTHATDLTASTTAELRAAITQLNASSDGIADTITLLGPGPFLLDCGTTEDDNADGDLDYNASDALTITYGGPGRATIAVDQSGDGCTNERVIHFRGLGLLRLEHIVITGGDLSGSPLSFNEGGGGGIAQAGGVASRLELVDVVVEGNRSSDAPSGTNAGGPGGGVFNFFGTTVITDSIIRDNVAGNARDATADVTGGVGGAGGGVAAWSGTVELVDTIVEANRAGNGGAGSAERNAGTGGDGGGVASITGATITITGGRIGGLTADRGNVAGDAGTAGAAGLRRGGRGGGVSSSTGDVTITDAAVSYNRAGLGTGPDGAAGVVYTDGGGIYADAGLDVDGSTITGNVAGDGFDRASSAGGFGGRGGGVAGGPTSAISITDTVLSDNAGGRGGDSTDGSGGPGGGGGAVFAQGTVDITRSSIVGNSGGTGGVGVGGTQGGQGGSGGGVGLRGATATIVDTLIQENAGGTRGLPGNPGNGGGVSVFLGTLDIERSTLAGNTGGTGGGVSVINAEFTATNTTFDTNVATDGGGGLAISTGSASLAAATFAENSAPAAASIVSTSGTVTVARTAFADAVLGEHCVAPPDALVDGGDSIEHDATGVGTCGVTTVTSPIELAPLADNGGPTPTRLPTAGGFLVDAIDPGGCVETDDQRGRSRPSAQGCDIGAVELTIEVTAVDDEADVGETPSAIDVLANDSAGPDGTLDPSLVTVTTPPTSGSTTVDTATGEITYETDDPTAGTDSFVYEVCAAGVLGVCDSATVSLDITPFDREPDPFVFADQVDVPTASQRTSNAVSVTGIDTAVAITVSGGTYSVNGAAFTAAAGTVVAGDEVRARHTSSAAFGGSIDTTVTIGDVADTFTSTTVKVAPIPDGATRFVPLPPERLFDTRFGTGVPLGKVAADDTLDVQVTGNVGVPAGAVAVVVNITVDQPDGPAFVTAFPRGATRPLASTLNITAPGQIRPNLAIVPLSDDGGMAIYAQNGMHLLGDVAGYFESVAAPSSAGRIVPLAPARLFDTRPTEPGNGPKGFVGADSSISVQVTGVAGVPATGVAAVVVNVTATESAGPNFVTVWPTGSERPTASSLNVDAGGTAANLVMVPVGADGEIDLYTLSGAHLLGDVTGYVTDDTASVDTAGLFVPLDPGRVFDTRPTEPGNGPKGFVAAGSSITTQTGGVAGVPDGAAAAVLNVTATDAATGFITSWPSGGSAPLASTLNLQGPGDTRANAAILPIGVGGGIDYFSQSGAHLIADTTGYLLG